MDGSNTIIEQRLVLPDGRVLLSDGRVAKPVAVEQPAVAMSNEIKSGRESARILSSMSRKLSDLPDTPDKMNAMGAVVTYTLLGLSDEDIALALKTTPDKIKMLKELDAYVQLVQMLDKSVIEDSKRAANHMLAKAATHATQRMIDGIDSNREDIAIVAARDVMKAAGVGAAADAEKRIGGLNIRIIRKGEHTEDDISVELSQ